jgi:uracil-DNA glycosylase
MTASRFQSDSRRSLGNSSGVTAQRADAEPAESAAPFVPAEPRDLEELAAAARGCRGCELYQDATQTVFGAGAQTSRIMLVGEQPGDQEDKEGEPFVGPAGRLLDRALAEAGIDRSAGYVTNAVKHFRFTTVPNSPRRLHASPSTRHVRACHPWLDAEFEVVRPLYVVALGAVAAQALFGSKFRLTRERGTLLDWPPVDGPYAGSSLQVRGALATIHPSAVLRSRSASDRAAAYDGLVADLRVVAELLDGA